MPNTTRNQIFYPDGIAEADNLTFKTFAEEVDARLIGYKMMESGKRVKNICLYNETVSNGTGYILIQTNLLNTSSVMVSLNITGLVYQSNGSVVNLSVKFYPFEGDGNMYQVESINKGSFHISRVDILTRNSDNKVAIALTSGAAGNFWEYPKLAVDGVIGHLAVPDSMINTGWSITRVASLAGYTVKSTPLSSRGLGEDTGWITPTLINGWTQYEVPNWIAQYRRRGGIVHWRGLLKPPTTNQTLSFVSVPVGFRPQSYTLRGAIDAGSNRCQLYVNPDGGMYTATTPHPAWLSVEGITYSADI